MKQTPNIHRHLPLWSGSSLAWDWSWSRDGDSWGSCDGSEGSTCCTPACRPVVPPPPSPAWCSGKTWWPWRIGTGTVSSVPWEADASGHWGRSIWGVSGRRHALWPACQQDNAHGTWWGREMIGVLGHDSALLRLYWAGDNLGEWDEFCYESCPGGEEKKRFTLIIIIM